MSERNAWPLEFMRSGVSGMPERSDPVQLGASFRAGSYATSDSQSTCQVSVDGRRLLCASEGVAFASTTIAAADHFDRSEVEMGLPYRI